MVNVKKVYEDAMMAAGAGAGPSGLVSPDGAADADADVVSKGTGTEDVIGKFDPDKGFMAKDNFFKPKNVLGKGKVMKRNELPYGSKKKKNLKNDYVKGMKVISEAELDRDTILAIHRVKESDMRNFILKFFGDEMTTAMYVQAIVYFPVTKTFFMKIVDAGEDFKGNQVKYVNLDFDGRKFKLTDDLSVYSANEVKRKYSDLLGMKGWVVWGGI